MAVAGLRHNSMQRKPNSRRRPPPSGSKLRIEDSGAPNAGRGVNLPKQTVRIAMRAPTCTFLPLARESFMTKRDTEAIRHLEDRCSGLGH